MFAFSAAVLNWIIGKITGLRFLSHLAQQVTFVMVPPLFLIFLVLGTIFIGVATPTEGGAMGASGAILLAIFKRWLDGNPNRFNLALLKSAIEATAKLSAFVVFILVGARIFSLTFYGVNGHVWVEHLLTSLPGGQVGFLIFINIFVFLLAFFLDFFEIAFIVIPLIGPAAEKIGIDLIWLGVMLGVNMQTSFMHPPFGFALFYLRSVAAREPYKDKVTGAITDPVTTGQIYWGAVPFVVIQCIMVGLVIGFPQMVMHYKSQAPTIDPSTIEIRIPAFGTPPAPGGLNIPPPPGLTPPADLAPRPQSAAPPTPPPGPLLGSAHFRPTLRLLRNRAPPRHRCRRHRTCLRHSRRGLLRRPPISLLPGDHRPRRARLPARKTERVFNAREAAPAETVTSLKWRSRVATTALSPALLQPAPGATNEEWPHGNHEQWDGHEEVGKHNREPINEAEPRDAVAREADNKNQRGEYSDPFQEIERFLRGLLEQPGAILAPIRQQFWIEQVLDQLPEPFRCSRHRFDRIR